MPEDFKYHLTFFILTSAVVLCGLKLLWFKLSTQIHRVFGALYNRINELETNMSAEFDALVAEVAEVKTVEQSAVVLIQGLADAIAAAVANDDRAALADLAAQLKTSTDALAASVTANTPAAPPAP